MDCMQNIMNWIASVISQNISAITGLLGVYIGAQLANRQTYVQRKLDFYEKQLRELYSPLMGIRKEIRILSEFRVEGEKASDEWWKKVCEYSKRIKDPQEVTEYFEKKGVNITTQIEYNNKQLREKIIPSYRKMIEILKNNYWLAEEETKKHLPNLIKFVETWERFLSDTHPVEVIEAINVREEELAPFYDNVEVIHNSLRDKLKKGKI